MYSTSTADGAGAAGAPATTCGWLARVWHRRLRRLDARMLIPAFQRAVARSYPQLRIEEQAAKVEELFAVHMGMPGAQHWRCACAAAEISEEA